MRINEPWKNYIGAVMAGSTWAKSASMELPETWLIGFDNRACAEGKKSLRHWVLSRQKKLPRKAVNSAPGEIRTPDPLIRSQML